MNSDPRSGQFTLFPPQTLACLMQAKQRSANLDDPREHFPMRRFNSAAFIVLARQADADFRPSTLEPPAPPWPHDDCGHRWRRITSTRLRRSFFLLRGAIRLHPSLYPAFRSSDLVSPVAFNTGAHDLIQFVPAEERGTMPAPLAKGELNSPQASCIPAHVVRPPTPHMYSPISCMLRHVASSQGESGLR
jgi:hypothetical protein